MDKNSSKEALRRWRSAVTIAKNPRQRFRMIVDLKMRSEAEKRILRLQTRSKELALPLLTEKEHTVDINQGTNQNGDSSTPKINDCPSDFPSVLTSSSYNGNVDVFNGISTRENTNSHPNVDESALRLIPKTEHIVVIDQDNSNNRANQSGDDGSTPEKVSLE